MRFVILSDTHGQHGRLSVPPGDVLVHAGDFSYFGGEPGGIEEFGRWFWALPHPHKIVIAGNHEHPLERRPKAVLAELFGGSAPHWNERSGMIYLLNEGVTLEGLKIYGTPVQPAWSDGAFNVKKEGDRAKVFAAIPGDVDVLITHVPPRGTLDQTPDINDWEEKRLVGVGCDALRRRVAELGGLKLHIFGHVHHAYGAVRMGDGPGGEPGRLSVNAALCDGDHWLKRGPIVVDMDDGVARLVDMEPLRRF